VTARGELGATGAEAQAQAGGREAAPLLGVAGILAAAALWALVGLLTRRLYAISALSPVSVGALRLMLAAPAIVAISAGVERPSWDFLPRDRWLFALYGLVMAAYQLSFLAALTRTTVTAATLLLTTAPVFVAILAGLFLGERPALGRVALLTVAVAGAALVILGSSRTGSAAGSFRLDPGTLVGDALALCAALAYACYYLLSSVLGMRYGGIQVMGVAIAAGAALLLPVAVAVGGLLPAVARLDVVGWALVLVLALGSTALSYTIYGLAMRRTPATLASVAALVEPVIAAVLAWRFLGERLAPSGLAGAILLLGGIAGTYLLRSRKSFTYRCDTSPGVGG
jgi:DME family drug/metabolite transporter